MKAIITQASLALLVLFLPSQTLAAVGGRCSNNWGDDCICLDINTCRNRWNGVAYSGSPGNWPCPYDPDNVMACIIRPCPGRGGNTQCLWTGGCRSISPGELNVLLAFACFWVGREQGSASLSLCLLFRCFLGVRKKERKMC
jgi:hypothetical protein